MTNPKGGNRTLRIRIRDRRRSTKVKSKKAISCQFFEFFPTCPFLQTLLFRTLWGETGRCESVFDSPEAHFLIFMKNVNFVIFDANYPIRCAMTHSSPLACSRRAKRQFSKLSSHVKIKVIFMEIKKNRHWTPLNSSARIFSRRRFHLRQITHT